MIKSSWLFIFIERIKLTISAAVSSQKLPGISRGHSGDFFRGLNEREYSC